MGKAVNVSTDDHSAQQLAENAQLNDVSGHYNRIGTSDITLGDNASFTNTTTDHGSIAGALGFSTSIGEKALAALDNANARVSGLVDKDANKNVAALQDTLTKTSAGIPVWVWAVGAVAVAAAIYFAMRK